jgi:hypothetical protein
MPQLRMHLSFLVGLLWRVEQTVLPPRIHHPAKHLAKLWAQAGLALQASEIRDDFECHQALMIAALAMGIGAHQCKCACEHGLQAGDGVFGDVGGLHGGVHGGLVKDYLVRISLPWRVACST